MGVEMVASVAREVVSMERRDEMWLLSDCVADRAVLDDWMEEATVLTGATADDGTKAAAGEAARRTRTKDFIMVDVCRLSSVRPVSVVSGHSRIFDLTSSDCELTKAKINLERTAMT